MSDLNETSSHLISVIIPVYNVERYLSRCVDSVLAQTYRNLEVILVDDGSPDNSPAICDEYAAKDSRVRVIHKKNGGVCSARNAGLDVAVGEYITFVDSDDWISEAMYQEMIEIANRNAADIVFCGMQKVYENASCQPYSFISDLVDVDYMSRDQFLKFFSYIRPRNNYDTELHSPANKIYRKSVVSGLYFDPEMRVIEDYCFNIKVFDKVSRVGFSKGKFYNYRCNSFSATSSFKKQDYLDFLKCLKLTESFYEKNRLPKISLLNYERRCLYNLIACLLISSETNFQSFLLILKSIRSRILLAHVILSFFEVKKVIALAFAKFNFTRILYKIGCVYQKISRKKL